MFLETNMLCLNSSVFPKTLFSELKTMISLLLKKLSWIGKSAVKRQRNTQALADYLLKNPQAVLVGLNPDHHKHNPSSSAQATSFIWLVL